MNELKIIDERELLGKEFRIYGDFENPLFLAKDVADWIGHSNVTTMLNSIETSEKLLITSPKQCLGGLQPETSYNFLTEDGLYEVLMLSRKPIAKEFKKQVKEILKTIRKNGMYATDELLNNPDLAIKAFTRLKEEQEKRKALETQIEEQRPQVIFAQSVETSENSILIGDLAKLIKQNGVDMGQNRLFDWMRVNGFLISRRGESYNMPTQKSMDLGLFEIKERTTVNPDGSIRINKTPKVTGKGQIYFINKFIGGEVA